MAKRYAYVRYGNYATARWRVRKADAIRDCLAALELRTVSTPSARLYQEDLIRKSETWSGELELWVSPGRVLAMIAVEE